MADDFFNEQTEQSQIKTAVVTEYFWSWAKVITGYQKARREKQQIAYIDLFAGPGRYDDGSQSTPLLILEQAIADPSFRDSLVSVFNDKAEANVSELRKALGQLPGIGTLRHAPELHCNEVGTEIVKLFDRWRGIPTLLFVDPWGYKGLSLQLINSVLCNWACECIFFFNYNRISMGLGNPAVEEHMAALFGPERAAKLSEKIYLMAGGRREMTIVEELCMALREMGGRYVLPFRFRNAAGNRTSHHLIFVSKHPLGYKIMKRVMAAQSSAAHQGVASFEYNPADKHQPFLFGLLRPLDDLEAMLLEEYAGRTMTMEQVYEAHNVDRPYTDTNYKNVLKQMEIGGRITADPPHTARRKIKGEVTFADTVRVTFPPRPQ